MKRIVSLVLIITVLLFDGMILTSCQNAAEEILLNQPAKKIADGLGVAMDAFFEGGVGIYDVVQDAQVKSALSFYLKGKDALREGVSLLEGEVYLDKEANQYGFEGGLMYQGVPTNGQLFLNRYGIVAKSSNFFGSDYGYSLSFEECLYDFEDSALAEALGFDQNMSALVAVLAMAVSDMLSQPHSVRKTELYELLDTLCEAFGQKAVKKDVKIGGQKVKCTVVSYSITNKTLAEAIMSLYDVLLAAVDTTGELEKTVSYLAEVISEGNTFDYTLQFTLNQATNGLERATLYGMSETYSYDLQGDTFEQVRCDIGRSLDVIFSQDRIAAKYVCDYDGCQDGTCEEYILTKAVSGTDTIYNLEAKESFTDRKTHEKTVKTSGVRLSFLKDGTVFLDAKGEEEALHIVGLYRVEKTAVSFDLVSLTTEKGDEIKEKDVQMGITLTSAPSFPSLPNTLKNILSMTATEVERWIKRIKESDIWKLG